MKEKLDFKKVVLLVGLALLVMALGSILVLPDNPAGVETSYFTATAVVANQPPTLTPPTLSRNNGSPCDPNNPPPAPPARNAGINLNPPVVQVVVTIFKSQHPETAAHIEAAQAAGHPKYLTIDRKGNINSARRNQAVNICPIVSGAERDEYPPAMFAEGGQGASVRYVEPKDNSGAGGRMGRLLQSYKDGTIVEIVVVP